MLLKKQKKEFFTEEIKRLREKTINEITKDLEEAKKIQDNHIKIEYLEKVLEYLKISPKIFQ